MVNVIGLGYIGLPTALMLAAHGVEVVGTDLNETLVGKLAAGELTFEEKGLDSLFEEDIQMQDALEDIELLTDRSEDIILGAIDDRADAIESDNPHLFTNEASELNADGLTEEEERQISMALLNKEDDFLLDDDEDFIDDIIGI